MQYVGPYGFIPHHPLLKFDRGTLYPDVIESLSFKGPSATIKVCPHPASVRLETYMVLTDH